MFEDDMSPKILNVERLERKFASLTRSRESIQGLSTWIIRHKEFYKEIVNQWLDALTRDFNALTMFYVANDVIQNCSRKKAPEYRDAFAAVLERAVSLEKVKEIKSEVTRMITLWHERSIYDDPFFKKLEQKLNSVVESDESEEEEESSEADVIASYKLENLIKSLRELKTLEDELSEKKSFLEDIEEPVISNMDNLIVRMESQREMRKFDRYQKLVEDFLRLSDKVIAAEKSVILDLKYSNIFYSAQNEDAKKVAHAYRIYGKKVKMVEKSLLEKVLTFPEPSPVSTAGSIPSPSLDCDVSQNLFSSNISQSLPNNKERKEENVAAINLNFNIAESELSRKVPNEICKASPDKSSVPTSKSESKTCVPSMRLNDDKSAKKPIKPVDKNSEATVSAENLATVENISSSKIKRLSIEEIASKSSKSPDQSLINATVTAEHLTTASNVSSKAKRLNVDDIKSTKSLNENLTVASTTVLADTLATANSVKSKVKRLSVEEIAPKSSQIEEIVPQRISTEKTAPKILNIEEIAPKILSTKEIATKRLSIEESASERISVEEIAPKSTKSLNGSLTKATVLAENLDTTNSVSSKAKISNIEEIAPKSTKSVIESSTETAVLAENVTTIDSINLNKVKDSSISDIHDDCIDFLLEKAYDVRVKSKTNFKRKIDNLLKLKQAKACKLTNDECSMQNSEVSENLVESLPVSKASENEVKPIVHASESVNENKTDVVSKSPVSMEITITDEKQEPIAVSVNATETDVSKQIVDAKGGQSLAVTSSSEVPCIRDNSGTKDIPFSTSLGFQTFPDIPTELLKNILNKHKVNMNLSSNIDLCNSSTKVEDPIPEKTNQDVLNSVNNNEDLVSETQVMSSGTSKSTDSGENSQTLVEDTNMPDRKISDLGGTKNSPDTSSVPINTPNFMQSVQDVLKCFTERKTSDAEYAETLCHSSSIPLENTLKLYSCLMQKYSKEYSIPHNTFDSYPTMPHKESTKSENSSEIKMEHNLAEIKPSVKNAAPLKNDNMEIMDMDVDSDDES